MPELAEVEYFRKRWDAGIGDNVVEVQLHAKKRIFRATNTAALKRQLANQRLLRSTARGKQMLFVFSDDNWLGIHLGMSGKLRTEGAHFRAEKHDHLVLRQKERALILSDARQFGRVRFHHGTAAPVWWEASAPEIHSPEFSLARMTEFVRRHGRAPIKAVLLRQSGFPGIGNWMADEILWRARIAPRRLGSKLNKERLRALWRSTRFVARASLHTIGRDNSDPPAGWLLHERWRTGGRCPRDGHVLRRASIGGRTTAWCALCQR
jgi:formamidopyrimidine-DNA glycosylase